MPLLTTPSGLFGYFNGPPPPFNPASLSAPLLTWFKGDAGLTSSSWTNYGTYGGSATLYSVTVTTHNGLNAADFTDEYSYGEFTWQWSGDQRAIFFVYRSKSNPPNNAIVTEQADSFYWGVYTVPGSVFQVSFNQALEVYIDPSVTLPLETATYSIVYAPYSAGSNNYASINGSYVSVTTSSDTGYHDDGNPTTAWFNSYGGTPNSGATGMVLCEVLCYDGVVTPTDATKVTNYLMAKWGTTPFDPNSVGSGVLVTWFGKNQSDMVMSGSAVVSWTQQAPSGSSSPSPTDATITGSAIRVLQNGLYGIQFQDTSSYGTWSYNQADLPPSGYTEARTIFVVGYCGSTSGSTYFNEQDPGTNYYYMSFGNLGGSGTVSQPYLVNDALSFPLLGNSSSGNTACTSPATIMMNYGGNAASSISIDGINQTTIYTTNDGWSDIFLNPLVCYLNGGGPNSGAGASPVTIFELLIYRECLNSNDVANVLTYLRNKWGTW
jgi:hypothetical protein